MSVALTPDLSRLIDLCYRYDSIYRNETVYPIFEGFIWNTFSPPA